MLADALGVDYAGAGVDAEVVVRNGLDSLGVIPVEVSVGDSAALTRARVVARVRGVVRRSVTPGVFRWLKRFFGRWR